MKTTTIQSSIRLHPENVITIQPWMYLAIIGQEFVTQNIDFTLENFENFPEVIGQVKFGKAEGKLLKRDESYFILLNDGRSFGYLDF